MDDTTWKALTDPIVRKLRLGAAINMNTSFNPDGSEALASLLSRMAKLLDEEIERIKNEP